MPSNVELKNHQSTSESTHGVCSSILRGHTLTWTLGLPSGPTPPR